MTQFGFASQAVLDLTPSIQLGVLYVMVVLAGWYVTAMTEPPRAH